VPVHEPLAVQEVALAVDQVRVALWPGDTALGVTVMLMDAGAPVVPTEKAAFPPELHAERASTESNSTTRTQKRDKGVSLGVFINLSFQWSAVDHCGLDKSTTDWAGINT